MRNLISIKKLIQHPPYCVWIVWNFCHVSPAHSRSVWIYIHIRNKIQVQLWPVHSSVAGRRRIESLEIMLNSLEREYNKNDNQWGKTFLIFRFYHKNDAIKFYSPSLLLHSVSLSLHHLDVSSCVLSRIFIFFLHRIQQQLNQHHHHFIERKTLNIKILITESTRKVKKSSNVAEKIIKFKCEISLAYAHAWDELILTSRINPWIMFQLSQKLIFQGRNWKFAIL